MVDDENAAFYMQFDPYNIWCIDYMMETQTEAYKQNQSDFNVLSSETGIVVSGGRRKRYKAGPKKGMIDTGRSHAVLS